MGWVGETLYSSVATDYNGSMHPSHAGRTRRQIPPFTPCGYCFERWATDWDHILPVSYRLDNSEGNLMPCCRRCNGFAGNLIFDSVEAKREYIRCRLKTKSRDAAMQAMQHKIQTKEVAPEILLPEVPVEIMGRCKPSKHHYPAREIRLRYERQVICPECDRLFWQNHTAHFFCSTKCRVHNRAKRIREGKPSSIRSKKVGQ